MAASIDLDATRERLIEASGIVFAEKGFNGATVREICLKAGANVAAINYHFRDKMGLYIEVLRRSMKLAHEETIDPSGMEPEAVLTAVIHGMVRRMHRAREGAAWHVRIMAHELAQPTAALDRVVEEVIGPRYEMLRTIVSRVTGLPLEHESTRMCVLSVIGQIVHYAHGWPVISRVCPTMIFDPDLIASHITTFSIGAMRSIAANADKHQTPQLSPL